MQSMADGCWISALVGLLLLGPHLLVNSEKAECQQELDLLYVLEYDGRFDWEPVHLSDPDTPAVLGWLLNLSDRLTVESHASQDLMVNTTFRLSMTQAHLNYLTNHATHPLWSHYKIPGRSLLSWYTDSVDMVGSRCSSTAAPG